MASDPTSTSSQSEIPPPSPTHARVPAPRGVLLGATAVLACFVGFQGPILYNEWQELRADWERIRVTEPVGFVNISPKPTMALPPGHWKVDEEGGTCRLWGGWAPAGGHLWFQVGADDLNFDALHKVMARDVIRSIREPLAEVGGGPIWSKLQPDLPVAGLSLAGSSPTAYPLLLLHKVEVVNDLIRDQPVLIVCAPFTPEDQAVCVFNPVHESGVFTMGLSGYLQEPGPRPVLYDHQTESLWISRDETLRCVAGPSKGIELPHIAHLKPEMWDDWVDRNPEGRLLVGDARKVYSFKPPKPAVAVVDQSASPAESFAH